MVRTRLSRFRSFFVAPLTSTQELRGNYEDVEGRVAPNLSASKILNGNLEADRARKEEPHEPLQEPLDLTLPDRVGVVVSAEAKSRQETAEKIRPPCVVGRGHESK